MQNHPADQEPRRVLGSFFAPKSQNTPTWEQRKVGTLIEDYTEKTVTQNQYPVLTSSQQQGIVLQEDYFADRQVTTDNNVGYYVLPKGYFTYRSRSDTDVFVFNRNNIVDKGIISYYYPVFAPKSCDSNFLLRRLNHGIKKQLSMAAEGTGQKVLAHAKFKNMVVDVPSQSEQEKIGTILEELDTLITLHQRKYEKLVNIKKSMLDKMFPQNGASVPEIRFKGFTDPWEQRKVGELLTERNEQAPMSDEYPLMAFIANEGVAPKGERYDRSALVNDTASKLYKKTKFGDFIYSSNNLETGSIGLNKYGKASISPVYSIFKPTGIADSDFLGRRLIRKDFINEMVKWRQGVIYGQWRIHESDFIKIEVAVPTVEEQCKLGLLLDNLDTLITLHQRKLEKLQNIKKSCLEKMFV